MSISIAGPGFLQVCEVIVSSVQILLAELMLPNNLSGFSDNIFEVLVPLVGSQSISLVSFWDSHIVFEPVSSTATLVLVFLTVWVAVTISPL